MKTMYAWFFGAAAAPIVIGGAPISTELWGGKVLISAGAQALFKGGKNIDIAGVLADGFTSPGLSAYINGAVNITPFRALSPGSGPVFTIAGYNKGTSEFFTEASTSYISGKMGDATWAPLEGATQVHGLFEKSALFISTQTSIGVASQAATEIINKNK